MTILTDLIAAELATLVRETDVPASPPAYGADLSCVSDITADLDEVDGDSLQAVFESLARRLTSPRGSLADDDEYGYDLRSLLNRGSTQQDLIAAQGLAENECEKDDRVDNADAVLTASADFKTLHLTLSITPVGSDETFTGVLVVNEQGALLELGS